MKVWIIECLDIADAGKAEELARRLRPETADLGFCAGFSEGESPRFLFGRTAEEVDSALAELVTDAKAWGMLANLQGAHTSGERELADLRAQLAGEGAEHQKLADAADDLLEAATANGYDRPLRDFYLPLSLSRLAAWFRKGGCNG